MLLPGYEAILTGDSAVAHSQKKLEAACRNLEHVLSQQQQKQQQQQQCSIVSLPCTTVQETLGYRSKCSFQLILRDDNGTHYQYAMRHKGIPEVLESSTFAVANPRIQSAMQQFYEQVLNPSQNDTDDDNQHQGFPTLVNKSLTSLTFAASWGQAEGTCSGEGLGMSSIFTVTSDCIVTLHYESAIEEEDKWLEEAKHVCQLLGLTQLHGRSRKRLLSAVSTSSNVPSPLGSYLRDTIYLIPPKEITNADGGSWKVSLTRQSENVQQRSAIPVHYHKPEGAFFHPNAHVMCQALAWMLHRIAMIVTPSSIASTETSPKPYHLLEMYCGCGAHTLALAKSKLLASILAVELDQRLVDACKVNMELNNNNTRHENPDSAIEHDDEAVSSITPIQVVRGHAGQWAKKQTTKNNTGMDYQILLVDPPRQGLDQQVIDLAIKGDNFQDVLIISCGHEALVRDLKLLCEHFDIMNCTQLDLFPRTDSVETLVHLKRRL